MAKTKEQEREEYILADMSRCVYFTGIQNETCDAGVNIRELVGGPDLGWARRMPCFLKDADKCTVTCSARKFMTRQESEEQLRKDHEDIERYIKAAAAAAKDAKEKGFRIGLGGADSMPCPLGCGGRLYYRVASCNGHLHAKCETPGCVSWME